MITLADMLTPANLPSDPQVLSKITETLSQGALDPDPYVSESAVAGLSRTEIMFSSFFSTVRVWDRGFTLFSEFKLGSGSKAINLGEDEVVLTLGSYTVAIPSNSFHSTPRGSYEYEGTIDGVKLHVRIVSAKEVSDSYRLTVTADASVNVSHPAIELTIGNNMGIGSVRLVRDLAL